MANKNKEIIIKAFREISQLEENMFKSRAYLRAISHLESMTQEEFDNRKTFMNLPGIGMSLNTKLLQFKQTGEIPAKLYKLREENKSYLDPQLYKIRKGFITKRIPYSQANEIVEKLEIQLLESIDDPDYQIDFLGSYRRHKSLIADLDLIVLGEEFYKLTIETIQNLGYEVVVMGPTKTTFVINNPEKTTIDVSWAGKDEYVFSVLHFTGSASHNIRIRAHAKSLGFKLNQYGIYPETEEARELLGDTKFETEHDIFEFLNIPYVAPENR